MNFDHLSGAAHTQKLIEILNYLFDLNNVLSNWFLRNDRDEMFMIIHGCKVQILPCLNLPLRILFTKEFAQRFFQ